MGLFGNPRKNKDKWAQIVITGDLPSEEISEELLIKATEAYISQHLRRLYESINLLTSTKNKATRKSRYELANKDYVALLKVYKYCDKKQKKILDQATNDFLDAEDSYKYPHRAEQGAKLEAKRREREEFWETYGMMEMIDIFCDDLNGKD